MQKGYACHFPLQPNRNNFFISPLIFSSSFFLSVALQNLWGKGDYKQEMEEMLIEHMTMEASPPKSPLQLLQHRTVRWQLITMFIIYSCNQMSGMSAVRMIFL